MFMFLLMGVYKAAVKLTLLVIGARLHQLLYKQKRLTPAPQARGIVESLEPLKEQAQEKTQEQEQQREQVPEQECGLSNLQYLWYGIYQIKNPLCYLSETPLLNWHEFENMKFELQNAKPIASYICGKKSFVQQLQLSRIECSGRVISR